MALTRVSKARQKHGVVPAQRMADHADPLWIDVVAGNQPIDAAHVIEYAFDRSRAVTRIGKVAGEVAERRIIRRQHDITALGQFASVSSVRLALPVDDFLAQRPRRMQSQYCGQPLACRSRGGEIQEQRNSIAIVDGQRERLASEFLLANFLGHSRIERDDVFAVGLFAVRQLAHGLLHAGQDLLAPMRQSAAAPHRLIGTGLIAISHQGCMIDWTGRRRSSAA